MASKYYNNVKNSEIVKALSIKREEALNRVNKKKNDIVIFIVTSHTNFTGV
jgi:hypothetical protein